MHIFPLSLADLKTLAVINTVVFIGVMLVIEFSSVKARRRYRYWFGTGVVGLAVLTVLGATLK